MFMLRKRFGFINTFTNLALETLEILCFFFIGKYWKTHVIKKFIFKIFIKMSL